MGTFDALERIFYKKMTRKSIAPFDKDGMDWYPVAEPPLF